MLSDVANGFDLWSDKERNPKTNEVIAVTSDDVTVTCGASKYHYRDDITWTYRSEDGRHSTSIRNMSLPGEYVSV